MTDTLVQVVWSGFIVAAFIGLLILPAAVIENWHRLPAWLKRLRELQAARERQAQEHVEADAHRRKVSEAASLIERNGWNWDVQ